MGLRGLFWVWTLIYHVLCHLLAGYSNLKDFWSNDLPFLSEGYWNRLLLWILLQTVRTRHVWTTLSRRSKVRMTSNRQLGADNLVLYKQQYNTMLCYKLYGYTSISKVGYYYLLKCLRGSLLWYWRRRLQHLGPRAGTSACHALIFSQAL